MIREMKKRAAALILGGVMVLAATAPASAAPQGSQENPLVTLSYLQDVFKAAILQEVQARIDSVRAGYESALEDKIEAYTLEMEALVGDSDLGSAVFSVVELSKGEILSGTAGGEVIFRSGAGSCMGGLVDSTNGNTLSSGKSVIQNHMYLILADGQAVKVTSTTATVMVRGEYKVDMVE